MNYAITENGMVVAEFMYAIDAAKYTINTARKVVFLTDSFANKMALKKAYQVLGDDRDVAI